MGKIIDLTATYGIDCNTAIDEIIVGDIYQRRIKVKGLDVTNYIGRCHWLKRNWDSGVITASDIQFATNNNITPTDIGTEDGQPIGYFTITITPAESSTLTPTLNPNTGIIYGDLQIDNGNGSILTVYRFQTTIRGEATTS